MQVLLLSPPVIFSTIWLAVIVVYSIRLANWLPDISTGLIAIVLSVIMFNVAYFFLFANTAARAPIRIKQLKRESISLNYKFLMLWIILTLLIIGYNYFYRGATIPLIAKYFNYDVNYLMTYDSNGSGMAIANAFLWTLVPLSFFVRSKILSIIFRGIPIIWFILLFNRGCLMLAIIEYAFISIIFKKPDIHLKFSIRKTALKIALIIGVIFALGWIGDARAGRDNFLLGWGIDPRYWFLPSSFIWILTYFSFPFANFISLLNNFNDFYYGKLLLFKMLPSILFDKTYGYGWINSYLPNEFNNVPTSLGVIYVDFGWIGIMIYSLLLGIAGWYLFKKVFINGNALIIPYYAFYLTVLLLAFFENFIFWTPTIYHLLIMFTVFRRTKLVTN